METVNGSTYLRRRVDMSLLDEEFYKNLNIVTDRFLMLSSSKQSYSFNEFRTTVISYLIDDYRDNLSDEDYDNLPYDEVYDFLLNYFYDKIKDRYVEAFGGDINESIKKVLKEERKLSNFLIRRLNMLDYEVEKNLYGSQFGGSNICIFFKSDIEYFESIMENSIDAMYYNHFSHIDDNSGEWAHEYLDMVDYIKNKYKGKIIKHYDDNCGSGSIPLKESIRKVLREESIQDSLFDMIKTDGFKKAAKAVGGGKRLMKILNLDGEDLDEFIYQYLTDNLHPDYNWGPKLHNLYKEEVKKYGIYEFSINDEYCYAYLGEWDGYDYLYTLVISKWTNKELTSLFGDKWIPVFKKWFEYNSGLEVREIDLENKYLHL